jgi:hypothetical protein
MKISKEAQDALSREYIFDPKVDKIEFREPLNEKVVECEKGKMGEGKQQVIQRFRKRTYL